MKNSEQLKLDDQGLPILTDVVPDDEMPPPPDLRLAARIPAMKPGEIAADLLDSEVFRNQIGEVAASLSRNVCEQMDQSLKPALEEAISRALAESDTDTTESVRQQLEAALPDLVAEALQTSKETTG